MKIIKNIFLAIFIFMFIFCFSNVYAGDLNLDNLTFNAVLKENGDMQVTEVWDIDISDTNTLYKTFELNREGYDGFSEATVHEITKSGEKVPFNQINEEMYHVTKGAYYSLINSNSDYEIAWGVSINGHKSKKYEINYTVKNIIHNYSDCSELYWKFIGRDFEIHADSVKGIIILPENSHEKEDIRAWAHGPLNGNINIINNNRVEFEVDDFIAGNMLEIRIATPTDMFPLSNRVYEDSEFDNIINEETAWANEANLKRQKEQKTREGGDTLCILYGIILLIVFVKKLKKYTKILKENPKKEPSQKLDYYRDIPGGDDTIPTDATFIMELASSTPNVISSTLLDLALKKIIKFEISDDLENKKEIVVRLLLAEDEPASLREEEQEIYSYLRKIAKDKGRFTMKEFEKYIYNHSASFNTMIERVQKKTEISQEDKGIYVKEEKSEGQKYQGKGAIYIFWGFISIFIGVSTLSTMCNKWYILLLTFPIYIILASRCFKVSKRFNGFTQKGIDEKEKWKGLKKYMEDFSYLNEKEVPALVLWEKYLVYATAMGIAEKVLKQLKVKYPNMFSDENLRNTSYMYLMYNNGLNSSLLNTMTRSVNRAYTSATYTNYSSGGGFGGGFSGGGRRWLRWRRRRRPLNRNKEGLYY